MLSRSGAYREIALLDARPGAYRRRNPPVYAALAAQRRSELGTNEASATQQKTSAKNTSLVEPKAAVVPAGASLTPCSVPRRGARHNRFVLCSVQRTAAAPASPASARAARCEAHRRGRVLVYGRRPPYGDGRAAAVCMHEHMLEWSTLSERALLCLPRLGRTLDMCTGNKSRLLVQQSDSRCSRLRTPRTNDGSRSGPVPEHHFFTLLAA